MKLSVVRLSPLSERALAKGPSWHSQLGSSHLELQKQTELISCHNVRCIVCVNHKLRATTSRNLWTTAQAKSFWVQAILPVDGAHLACFLRRLIFTFQMHTTQLRYRSEFIVQSFLLQRTSNIVNDGSPLKSFAQALHWSFVEGPAEANESFETMVLVDQSSKVSLVIACFLLFAVLLTIAFSSIALRGIPWHFQLLAYRWFETIFFIWCLWELKTEALPLLASMITKANASEALDAAWV